MDLVAACRVFVSVGERGSFTLGAAAARVPQPVASRRVAALEKHFGAPLFDRSTRRATLTAFGRDLLPSAKRLVRLADALEDDAARAKLRPLTLAIPEACPIRHLASLDAAARTAGTVLDLRPAGPSDRTELLRTREVRAALLAVPPADADWTVPLGVATRPTAEPAIRAATGAATERAAQAGARSGVGPANGTAAERASRAAGGTAEPTVGPAARSRAGPCADPGAGPAAEVGAEPAAGSGAGPADQAGTPAGVRAGGVGARRDVQGEVRGGAARPLHLSSLRPGRGQDTYRRIWLQPEDDVPHVRDRLEQAGHRAALVPAQVSVAASLVAAVSEAAGGDGLLLCAPAQAEELGLDWRPLAGAPVARGYRVSAVTGDDADRLRTGLGPYVAAALGGTGDDGERHE